MKKVAIVVISLLAIIGFLAVTQWIIIQNNIGKTKEGIIRKIK